MTGHWRKVHTCLGPHMGTVLVSKSISMSPTLGCCPQERALNGLFLFLHEEDCKESCSLYLPLSRACSESSCFHSKLTSARDVFSVGGAGSTSSHAAPTERAQRLEKGCFPISRPPTPTGYETSADRGKWGSTQGHGEPQEPLTGCLSGPRNNAFLT